jgi:5-deoxy-glucuronate isomerase
VAGPVIHASAPPNDLATERLRLRPDPDGAVSVDPPTAGWRYLSFRTALLEPDSPVVVGGLAETAVVLIAGGDLRATTASGEHALRGRRSPFEALPSGLYLPPGSTATLATSGPTGPGGPGGADETTLVAVATAPPSGRDGVSDVAVPISATDIRVEIRGAGNATRQINHIIAPAFPADRLEVVEVLTPSGNWSSWPPHKHDVDAMPDESVLEEIYYYRFERPEAWGLQRLYRPDRSRDATWEVRSGEVVLVTDGYHPFVASHGDTAYYLNALAGDRRTMACSFDPDLDWVRETWASMEPDPRVPLVTR